MRTYAKFAKSIERKIASATLRSESLDIHFEKQSSTCILNALISTKRHTALVHFRTALLYLYVCVNFELFRIKTSFQVALENAHLNIRILLLNFSAWRRTIALARFVYY